MKKTNPIHLSAEEAFDVLKRYTYYASENIESEQGITNDIFGQILEHIPGIVMVIDLHANRYVYINSPEIVGFDKSEFVDGGLARALLAFPASHGYIMIHHIFPIMFKYFEEYSSSGKHKGLKASYQTQFIHKDGSLRWFDHTMSVLSTDERKGSRLLLKTLQDIQDYKKDTYIDFTVSYTNSENKTEVLFEARHLPEITNTVLSEREGQVLSLISLGLTSAQIADKLFISQHTVNTHRKNILKKTFCKGTADLAIFALTAGGQ